MSTSCGPSFLQERQRLETILSLCSEFGSSETSCPERSPGVCAISNLQRINHELEKLQVLDDDLHVVAAPEDGLVVKGEGERQLQTTNILQTSVSSPSTYIHNKVTYCFFYFQVNTCFILDLY